MVDKVVGLGYTEFKLGLGSAAIYLQCNYKFSKR